MNGASKGETTASNFDKLATRPSSAWLISLAIGKVKANEWSTRMGNSTMQL
jgi:hypothetical protein